MLKLIESAFLMGLGATSLTAKKAEEFVNKAISDKDITKEEGNQLLQTIIDEGKKAEADLKAKVDALIASRGESILTTYQKVQDLEARVAALEAKLAAKE